MLIKFTYTTDQFELLSSVGISKEKFWKYLSLDGWGYALIIDKKKTVGIAYHS